MSHHYERSHYKEPEKHESFKEHMDNHNEPQKFPAENELVVMKVSTYRLARWSFWAAWLLLLIFSITGIIMAYGDEKNTGGIAIFSTGLVLSVIIAAIYAGLRNSKMWDKVFPLIDYEKHHQHKGHEQARKEHYEKHHEEPHHDSRNHQHDAHQYNHPAHKQHNLFAHHH